MSAPLLSDEVLRRSKLDANGGLSRGSLYDFNRGVKFIDTQRGVLEALDDPKADRDPNYAQAIIDGYARAKLSKGKTLEDVDKKLHDLGKEIINNRLGPFVEQIQLTRDDLNKVPEYDAWKAGASGKSHSGAAAPPYSGEQALASGKEKAY